jgi:uncharacterized protein
MAFSRADPNAAQNRDNGKYTVNSSTSHPMAFPQTHFDTFLLDVIPGNGVSRSASNFFSQWMPAAFSHWAPTVLYWLLLLVMLLGIAGAVIPAVPGPTLIVGAIALAGLVYGWNNVAIPLVVACIVLALCFAIEYLAGVLGGQKAGASHWGQIGSMVGLGLGFFGMLPALPVGGPLVGIFFGPFIGAVLGELLYLLKKRSDESVSDLAIRALRAGIGIVVGSVIGLVMQGLLCLGAVIVFVLTTYGYGWPG